MRKIILLYLLVVSFITFTKAQPRVKPLFQHLVFITYQVEVSDGKQKVIIKEMADVDTVGRVHLRVKLFKGVADTTFQLNNEGINKINGICNGQKRLSSYKKMDKLRDGVSFGGEPQYVYYIDGKGNNDELNFISPIMEPKFNNAFGGLTFIPDRVNTKLKYINAPTFETRVIVTYNTAAFLSNLEAPPPIMINH